MKTLAPFKKHFSEVTTKLFPNFLLFVKQIKSGQKTMKKKGKHVSYIAQIKINVFELPSDSKTHPDPAIFIFFPL